MFLQQCCLLSFVREHVVNLAKLLLRFLIKCAGQEVVCKIGSALPSLSRNPVSCHIYT